MLAFSKHKDILTLWETHKFNNQHYICLRTEADKVEELVVAPE